jgi:hypothetical protein
VSSELVCQDGVLAGADTYLYNSCEKPKCDCKVDFLAEPVTLKHGDYIKVFSKNIVECGVCSDHEVQRQCVDGVLTGEATATHQSCTAKACQDCPISATEVLKHGASKDFFKTTTGLNCDPAKKCESSNVKLSRTCTNGVLTGDSSFNKLTCANQLCSCTLQNATYSSGSPVTYYKKSTVSCTDNFYCEDASNKVTTSCQDGVIANLTSPAYSTCNQAPCRCTYKDANGVESIIDDGKSLTVYTSPSVNCGVPCDSIKGTVTCNKGVLTGNTNYPSKSCTPASCGCKFGTQMIDDGKTIDVYSNAQPACGSTCAAAKGTVTCTKGVLSGNTTYTASSCKEQTCDCSYTNIDNQIVNIANGVSATVYSAKYASCGLTCDAIKSTVTCNNTVLSGQTSYKSSSCQPSSCYCTAPWGGAYTAMDAPNHLNYPTTFYKQNMSVCGQLKCNLIPNNTVKYYCKKDGTSAIWVDANGATVDPKLGEYKSSNCFDPTCNCQAKVGTATYSIMQSTTKYLYKTSSVACGQICDSGDNYIAMKCNDDLSITVSPSTANMSTFTGTNTTCAVAACPPGDPTSTPGVSGGTGDGQTGDGGGTGGGTGDGDGPGIGFKGRGGGGGSGGPSVSVLIKGTEKTAPKTACELPWGGRITNGSSAVAFKVTAAPAGKKCSEYRVYRMCFSGTLTGDATAVHLDCQETP